MKKLMAILLAVCLLVGLMSVSAFAEDVIDTEAELVAAVANGGTVTLGGNITIANKIAVTKDVVIDGAGFTLTYTGSDRAIDVSSSASGVNLTVKNLIVDCTASYCQRGINYNTSGNFTLDKVTVKGTNVTYAVNFPSSSDNAIVNITNSDLSGNIALNIWGSNMNITVTDTVLTSIDTATHENYAAIALNNDGAGGTADGTTISIVGGSITAKDENGAASSAIRNSTTATVSVSDTTTVSGEKNTVVAIVTYPGSDSFYGCFTLQDAIDKAIADGAGCEGVTLIGDVALTAPITVNGEVEIDLNGKTISYTNDVLGEAMITVTNTGDLTINDSSTDKSGKILYTYTGAADSGYSKGNYTIDNRGDMTLNAGTIEICAKDCTGKFSHALYAIENYSGSTLTINGGKVYNPNNIAIRLFGAGDITVNDGEIEGLRAIWLQLPSSDTSSAPEVNLKVTGGTLTGTGVGEGNDNKLAVYSYSYGNNMKNVTVDISGGTFNGDIALTGGSNKTNIETVKVTGGTFNGKWGDLYSYSSDDEAAAEAITITGGTFATDAAEIYALDNGYKFKQNSDGTYGVKVNYGISVDVYNIDFGSKALGYASAPAAKTITVTNTSTAAITLVQPTATNYVVGTLSKTELAAGETATFTIQPKVGLGVATYEETISVDIDGTTAMIEAEEINVTFKVSRSAQTGDSSSIILYATLMLIAAVGATTVFFYQRKNYAGKH